MIESLKECPAKTMTFGSGFVWCDMWNTYICIHRLFASLDLTAFWRGGLMHVVCLCACVDRGPALCIFGLNCLLAGRSYALRALTFHRHKVDFGHYICSVVCWKYRVCRLAFCQVVDGRFRF